MSDLLDLNEAQIKVFSCFSKTHLHLVLTKSSLKVLPRHDPTGRSKGVANIMEEKIGTHPVPTVQLSD